MALRSTQPLTKMSTRDLAGGKGRPARGADNLAAICEPMAVWPPRLPCRISERPQVKVVKLGAMETVK
jgi:hypothetical protein